MLGDWGRLGTLQIDIAVSAIARESTFPLKTTGCLLSSATLSLTTSNLFFASFFLFSASDGSRGPYDK